MDLARHFRRTLLTGVFAAIPIVATGIVVYYVDHYTRALAPLKIAGYPIPLLGVIVALVAAYLLGLAINTALAQWGLRKADTLLQRLPMVRPAYLAWKQVSLNQGPSGAGMWDRVVLVELETGQTASLAFTSGHPVAGAPNAMCVYVPSAPVPTTGRLYVVPVGRCVMLDIAPEEAFKHILSGGNYVPAEVGPAWQQLARTSATPAIIA